METPLLKRGDVVGGPGGGKDGGDPVEACRDLDGTDGGEVMGDIDGVVEGGKLEAGGPSFAMEESFVGDKTLGLEGPFELGAVGGGLFGRMGSLKGGVFCGILSEDGCKLGGPVSSFPPNLLFKAGGAGG